MTQYKEPTVDSTAYTCPHCGVLAQATHWPMVMVNPTTNMGDQSSWKVTLCGFCGGQILWHDGERRWPMGQIGPIAHPEMPEQIASLYDEARTIGAQSPRAAAALLRLALQHLVMDLAGGEKNVNKAIGALVKDGLHVRVQKAMDILRVVGNNAVHPGEIDLEELPDTVEALFSLLNFLVDDSISKPRQIDEVYSALPNSALAAIERRDGPPD